MNEVWIVKYIVDDSVYGLGSAVRAFSTRKNALMEMKHWYNSVMLEMLEDAGCAGITGAELEEFFDCMIFEGDGACLSDGKDYHYWDISVQEVM